MTTDIQGLFGLAAGVLSLLGFVPYIVEVVQGKTRPNRVTWWIWTIVGGMLGASYYASGARHTMWVPVSYVVGPLVTALLSLKYGEGGSTRFDRTCLGVCLLSIPLWWVARSPVVALVINVVIDLFAALPTLRTCYRTPEAESLPAWTVFLVADAFNLGAMGGWSINLSLYPAYLFILATVLVLLMIRPRHARGTAYAVRHS